MNERDYKYRFMSSDKQKDRMDREDAFCRGFTKAVLGILGAAVYVGVIVFLILSFG